MRNKSSSRRPLQNPSEMRRREQSQRSESSDILFYNENKGRFGCFSNFYPAQIFVDGKKWATVEHYYQAMKFSDDPALIEEVRRAATPGEAAALGSELRYHVRRDWHKETVNDDGNVSSLKLNVMRVALRAKFDQHCELRSILLSTTGRRIIENTKNDRYWANGGDNSGKNMLGKLLMELREILINEEERIKVKKAVRVPSGNKRHTYQIERKKRSAKATVRNKRHTYQIERKKRSAKATVRRNPIMWFFSSFFSCLR
ncbi:hypothetical protein KP509_14G044700 [Ceratopteris richardii]|uniref:NADAR domain-containing protein n=1 Tax=Ceratopteris richardii TaxID=49495 RepID=A0A8T2T924_CERRI|nr:hypothetical protein KP509_14G044700 [Ceratopteris richardii]KAH7415459.1 hypothetical protein KP509_14G044700 [Ceratopteris richardii]